MYIDRVLDELGAAPPPRIVPIGFERVPERPAAAQRYLDHALQAGPAPASVVRLWMHGTLRYKQRWYPFEAEEVIHWPRGFAWRARVKLGRSWLSGYDRWLDGAGALRWKLLGVLPVVTQSGPEISRSAAERMAIESIWLPSVLQRRTVRWHQEDDRRVAADLWLADHATRCELELDDAGRLVAVSALRWGNPAGHGFAAIPFGAVVEDERTFRGFTVPSELRVGWYFGSDRFEQDGEFLRCTVDDALYR